MSNIKEIFKQVFKEEYVNESYKMQGHSFSKVVGGKQVCKSCGLVALNNDFTRWSIDKGCYSDLHPEYKNARKRFTKMW